MLMRSVVLAALLQAVPTQTQGPTAEAAAAQLTAAEARYRAAIALSPGLAPYHESLARVLERQGRMDEALASHAEAVRLDPRSARARAGYGTLLLARGRVGEAVPQLRAAAELDPMSVDVRLQLADALGRSAAPGEAADVLRDASKLAPADSIIVQALAATADTVLAGRHDLSELPGDGVAGRATAYRVAEVAFAIILGLCSLAIAGPVVGMLLLLASQLPRALRRRFTPEAA